MHDIKRRRIQTDTFLPDDIWSHVCAYLCANAWDAAIDIANMTRASRAWRGLPLWTTWSETFQIFSFKTTSIPRVLTPLMKSAAERQGFVNQKTAMEHLKIKAPSLRNVPHKTLRLGLGRKMYLYSIGDVLRVATKTYKTVEALQRYMDECRQKQLQRAKNRADKEQRRHDVTSMLQAMDAMFILRRRIKRVEDYIDKNRGTLDAVRKSCTEIKRDHDAKQAKIALVNKRRESVRKWIFHEGLGWSEDFWMRVTSVQEYIYKGVGHADTVISACRAEKKLFDERCDAAAQNPAIHNVRRQQLVAELRAHGLEFRHDSRFCSQYIGLKTNASLEEVVATMKLTSLLFSYGHRTWSSWHDVLESRMREKMHSGHCSTWYGAYDQVVEFWENEEAEFWEDTNTEYDSDDW